ncbi:MAG: ThuA domain-containing protein [Verrucomicrobia bacterium]|nr:ThuA domain-containing protein [Verrucomicrobiota bacterium]
MQLRFLSLTILAALFVSAVQCRAIEPWADETLPVQNGLQLWLDASRHNAARNSEIRKIGPTKKRPQTPLGASLDMWLDASGHERDLHQRVPGMRPKLVQTPGGFAIRFDGVDDFLSGVHRATNFTYGTIFFRTQPKSNPGNFPGLLSVNRAGENDYRSGFNLDLGPKQTERFSSLNFEGSGFGSVHNFLSKPASFEAPHTITISIEDAANGIQVWMDGVYQGKRARKENAMTMEEVTLGARLFSNTGEPPHVQGFFDGDISEVLVYSSVFSPEERAQVESYLAKKYAVRESGGRQLTALTTISNLPPVQMFVPGFTVRELPVKLNNINCVKYREDGKLVALGYDGNIWLLSDTNGDGLEDTVQPFWTKRPLRSPIGMALTPPNYPRGRGVFVASKDRVALLLDTNNDDIADEEIIVASGWNESFHQVDALGCAVDKEGNVYFGLGTANFADGYLVDKATGKSTYSLTGERSTIMRVSPDFKTREVICTGIRFPVALEINSEGDLFCSDQEGATWLPNGNPLDELLHIQTGRHYGFPPRHPKHLPNVIDEPSTFDYGPQHQSTCGFTFNEKPDATFGPGEWRGDVFMTGYSRGKIWRTKLVKTPGGYVAQTQLIASLNMLPADNCVSPQGDLVIAVHSGQPDWGSGPNGEGKLYKITYADKETPQPVQTWAASASETHIEFDRPLDAAQLKELGKRLTITEGRYVSAGDPFEYWRPGYQVVQDQMFEPRYELKILSAAVDADGRTLIVRTTPRTLAVNYAVSLRGQDAARKTAGVLPQHDTIELAHDLTGVEAAFAGADGKETSLWLPHLDSSVARALTKASATHQRFWEDAAKPGKLTLRTKLDLWQMLRSATQPGSKLDFEYPDETVTVVLKSKNRIAVTAPGMKTQNISANEIHLTAIPKQNQWLPLDVILEATLKAQPDIEVSWFTAEDDRHRALPLRRFVLPWATPEESVGDKIVERVIPEIAGGNWLRGKKIYFGEAASCYKCHVFNGEGQKVGPELSNLIHRDYASVLKDILEPSAAINPDHISFNIELTDGESISGVPLGGSDIELVLADAAGRLTKIPKSQVASMKPSTISLMPEGLMDGLSEQERKDLLTYMMMPPPLAPAPLEIPGEPAPRKKAEVNALLKSSVEKTKASKSLRIVLCAGPKDHGPGEHDYPLWQTRWSKLLALAENVIVETADKWPSAEQMNKADVIVFYSNNPDWSPGRATELDAYLNRGGGVVYIHFAVDGHKHCDELAQRIGLAWRGGASAFRHGALDLKFESHPISAGFERAHFVDESYWNLIGSETNFNLLASGVEAGKPRPLMWTREQGKGRVFVSIPGHFTWTFDDPLFRLLILRGMAWTAHEPTERFEELITVGARVE